VDELRGSPSIDPERLPPTLARTYSALPPDPDRERWVATVGARPHGALASSVHRALRRMASDYDVDGWLGTHPMFLAGTASWRALLGAEHVGGALLDVGAGRGDVTAALAPLFDEVVATETSAPMVRRLRARGYEAHRIDLAVEPLPGAPRAFRAVSLLNVLDRCARPRSLLAAAVARLAPGGALVIACPLPARPHVDVGGHTVDPDEPLLADGEHFEDALASLAARVIEPAGLEIVRWTRTLYLARGDRDAPRHALDDAIVIARSKAA
jgi:SAM-dependent methyltransferase